MSAKPSIRTVMLIDDELVDQMIYKRVMDRSGEVETVITFQAADEALKFLTGAEREPVDVIFLDINMPRMTGFEFLEAANSELGDSFAKAVVMMLTTSASPHDIKRANDFDMVKMFATKPLTVDHIKSVSEILENSASF